MTENTEPPRSRPLLLPVQKDEWSAVAMAFGWFFLILFSYQLLRPVRDSLFGELSKSEKSSLFFATFVAMAVAVPIYSKLVNWLSRRWLVLLLVNGFALNILGFAIWQAAGGGNWFARVFFVWTSVFNLYATSLFWSVLTDLFSNEKGKRLFGPIAGGATLGGICASAVALMLVEAIGLAWLMVMSALAMELGVLFVLGLERATRVWPAGEKKPALSATVWEGIRIIFHSRYLLLIALYIALSSYFGTTFYVQVTEIVRAEIPASDERTAYLAGLNLAVQLGALVLQFLIVGPVMRRLGLTTTLAIMPLVAGFCLTVLVCSRSLLAISIVDITSRVTAYGFSVPSREVLFTLVSREAKYKSKNVIDTFVIRGSDTAASSALAMLTSASVSITSINALLLLPAAWWWLLSIRLGRKQHQLAEAERSPSAAATTD